MRAELLTRGRPDALLVGLLVVTGRSTSGGVPSDAREAALLSAEALDTRAAGVTLLAVGVSMSVGDSCDVATGELATVVSWPVDQNCFVVGGNSSSSLDGIAGRLAQDACNSEYQAAASIPCPFNIRVI